MPRTTAPEVQAIIETDDTITLTPFIAAANSIVTRVCAIEDYGYDEETLTLIETWLAAHFYAVRDLRVASEGVGPVSEAKQYKLGLNLQSTMYGQQAMLLDTEGGLAALNKSMEDGYKRRPPSVHWAGTEPTLEDAG